MPMHGMKKKKGYTKGGAAMKKKKGYSKGVQCLWVKTLRQVK